MSSTNTSSPDLGEVLRTAVQSIISDVHVALPGKIEKWDPVTQRADVKPLVKRVFYTFERDRIVEDLPVITDVPVLFPRSSDMFVSFPIKKDDHVLLVFNSRSIDQFLAKEGADVDPLDTRMHNLSDAVAIPGFYPDSLALKQVDANNLVVGQDDGGMQAHFKPDGTFDLREGGGSATEAFLKGNAFSTWWNTMLKATNYDVHVHGTPAGPSGPPVPLLLAFDATTLSTILKMTGT